MPIFLNCHFLCTGRVHTCLPNQFRVFNWFFIWCFFVLLFWYICTYYLLCCLIIIIVSLCWYLLLFFIDVLHMVDWRTIWWKTPIQSKLCDWLITDTIFLVLLVSEDWYPTICLLLQRISANSLRVICLRCTEEFFFVCLSKSVFQSKVL